MTDLDLIDREIPALAQLLIGRYGERALAFASLQALRARAQNRPRLMEAWGRIGDAAHQILRTELDSFAAPASSDEHKVERITRPAPVRVDQTVLAVKAAFDRAR